MVSDMTRITVDVNDEWLEAAREVLGTETKVATINEALRTFAVRRQAIEIAAAFAEVKLDLSGSGEAWGHHGGRPLDRLVEDARAADHA
jgi:Arc/MetJ family transcription regulator